MQHIENIKSFYEKELKWNRGPHLFVDEDQYFGMTSFQEKGIHAPSFNSNAIGIEVLGDFDSEDPFTGRGLQCWMNTVKAVEILAKWMKISIDSDSIVFHRECAVTQRTTRKSCPGKKITKEWVLSLIGKEPTVIKENGLVKIGKSFEPVIKFITQKTGISESAAVKKLVRKGKEYYYDNYLLEHAYYDVALGSTVAPITELMDYINQ
jgi:hypothetical protein